MRACDACHLRKIKCEASRNALSPSQDAPCKQCRLIRIDCTFNRPQQRRPRPIPKSRSKPSTSVASESTTSLLSPQPLTTPLLSPPGPSTFGGLNSSARYNHRSPPFSFGTASRADELRMDLICGPQISLHMISDYVSILYPLLPVVHLPSFQKDFAAGRAATDPVFFALLASLCSMVAVLLPRRFLEYQLLDDSFPYKRPSALVQRCIEIILPLRDSRYHESPSPEKCAIAYTLGYAAKLAGANGRSIMFWTETNSLLRHAGVQIPGNHSAWSCKDSQLYKKIFWMWYIVEAYAILLPAALALRTDHHDSHERVGAIRPRGSISWKPFPDNMFCDSNDIEMLLPKEVDDDYISETHVGVQPDGETSLVTGFNILARIYMCFMVFPSEVKNNETKLQCRCCIHRSPEHEIRCFEDLFHRVRYILANLPPSLAPWQYGDNLDRFNDRPQPNDRENMALLGAEGRRQSREEFLSSMRANIHITQLWARYVIFERLVALHQQKSESSALYSALLLSEHESLCEQLLYLLSNISFRSLESNGVSITFKIRQIAALFLQYQMFASTDRADTEDNSDHYDHLPSTGSAQWVNNPHSFRQEDTAHRAEQYIKKFLEILSRLDAFTFQDTQQVFWNEV